jgi:hypothetical protein
MQLKRRAIIMFSLFVQPFSDAEQAYRREQIMASYHRSPRRLHLKWPAGLLSPARRRPHHVPTLKPSPHN